MLIPTIAVIDSSSITGSQTAQISSKNPPLVLSNQFTQEEYMSWLLGFIQQLSVLHAVVGLDGQTVTTMNTFSIYPDSSCNPASIPQGSGEVEDLLCR